MSFKRLVEMEANRAGVEAAPGECLHLTTEVRSRTIRGGLTQHVRQCQFCGEPVGNPLKQGGQVPAFDDALRESYSERVRAIREKARREKSTEWWDRYRTYLESPEWADLRAKVLLRDGHLCQGCLSEKATEVHHLSYRNFGNEFAFQLKSLCRACHERFHEEGDE